MAEACENSRLPVAFLILKISWTIKLLIDWCSRWLIEKENYLIYIWTSAQGRLSHHEMCFWHCLFLLGKCRYRTTKGYCCSFPFVYRRRRYNSCASNGRGRTWCPITPDYNRKKLWGYCRGGKRRKYYFLAIKYYFFTYTVFCKPLYPSVNQYMALILFQQLDRYESRLVSTVSTVCRLLLCNLLKEKVLLKLNSSV